MKKVARTLSYADAREKVHELRNWDVVAHEGCEEFGGSPPDIIDQLLGALEAEALAWEVAADESRV